MTTPNLKTAFVFHRSLAFKAADAIVRARRDMRAGKARHGRTEQRVVYGPACPDHGERDYRWIENISDGLRFAGYADELARLRHTGWYIDDYCGESVRGGVWQLPARHGQPVYVPGYVDPFQHDAGRVSFDDLTDDKEQAAQWADRLASAMAKSERDCQRAATAGYEHADLAEEIADRRRQVLALLAERRAARSADCERFPTICAVIRKQVAEHVRRIGEARERRAELAESFGDADAFRDAA